MVVPGGLIGVIYNIRPNSKFLPDFQRLQPVGVIYTSKLDVTPRSFLAGFPGVTDRFEWFAIDYTGRFWIEQPGIYRFDLTSDDGSRLYIDDQLMVNNDGVHPPQTETASFFLAGGIHRIRVSYFQGPREEVALVLEVAGPGEQLRVFSTDEFKPPPNPETWAYQDDAGRSLAAMPGTNIRLSSMPGSSEDREDLEVLLESPPGTELARLKWEMVVPAELLELVGTAPGIDAVSDDPGRSIRCSTRRSYLYACTLSGGRKPIVSGPIAVFHFKARPSAKSRTTMLRIQKIEVTDQNQQTFGLADADGTLTIH